MIDYNLIVYIGIGLIVGGFILFIVSEMKKAECDRKLWKNEQLLKSIMKAKERENDTTNH